LLRFARGITSFAFNRTISFDLLSGSTKIELRRFLLLFLVSYHAALFFLYAFHELVGIPLLLAKPLSDGLCFFFNFTVMKFYVYNGLPGISSYAKRIMKKK